MFQVDKEMYKRRLNVCVKCESYNDTLNQCKECGCFLILKAFMKSSTCPLSKWPEEKKE
jgi:hypothetical protein